jgi:hypothetical protein
VVPYGLTSHIFDLEKGPLLMYGLGNRSNDEESGGSYERYEARTKNIDVST